MPAGQPKTSSSDHLCSGCLLSGNPGPLTVFSEARDYGISVHHPLVSVGSRILCVCVCVCACVCGRLHLPCLRKLFALSQGPDLETLALSHTSCAPSCTLAFTYAMCCLLCIRHILEVRTNGNVPIMGNSTVIPECSPLRYILQSLIKTPNRLPWCLSPCGAHLVWGLPFWLS